MFNPAIEVSFRLFIASIFVFFSLSTFAENFGIYDSRGLAMGGTTVAAGKTYQAQYYNPALLALHDVDEDDSQDGKFVFPNIVAQMMGPAEEVADTVNDNLEDLLTDAVNLYNAEQSAGSAAVVGIHARDLENLLQKLNRENLWANGFAGFSVSEPSLHEGGAFYFGVRAISVGEATIPEEDLILLNRYINAMDVLAAGGSTDDLPPDLVNESGELVDPSSRLDSSAELAAVIMGEWAISMAKQFTLFSQPISVGITPKLMQVEAFRDSSEFGQDNLSFENSGKSHLSMNLDIGVALELFEHYRIGLSVKDAIPHNFETEAELPITLRPRTRLGLAYVNDWVTVGLDVDVVENKPLAAELATQEASLGLEWSPLVGVDLRLGYRYDLMDMLEPIVSGGIGYQYKRFSIEASYASSEEITGASLQLGWFF